MNVPKNEKTQTHLEQLLPVNSTVTLITNSCVSSDKKKLGTTTNKHMVTQRDALDGLTETDKD